MISFPPQTIINELKSNFFSEKKIRVSVLRLDQIDPVISGNKIYKLHYFLKQATAESKTIITKGGAFSNHLVATAKATAMEGIKSIGIVRGEEPKVWSHTLLECRNYGMELHFVPRNIYAAISELNIGDHVPATDFIFVPEGGYHATGALGAREIMPANNTFTHFITAIGTATTMGGLLNASDKNAEVIGVPVLKGLNDIEKRLNYLSPQKKNYVIWPDHHFGGYAKYTPELIKFMNGFYEQFKIPTDFVYTGKMFFSLMDQVKNGYFKEGANILAIHTGGLQGNLSLPKDILVF